MQFNIRVRACIVRTKNRWCEPCKRDLFTPEKSNSLWRALKYRLPWAKTTFAISWSLLLHPLVYLTLECISFAYCACIPVRPFLLNGNHFQTFPSALNGKIIPEEILKYVKLYGRNRNPQGRLFRTRICA